MQRSLISSVLEMASGTSGNKRRHLLRAAQVVGVVGHAHALGVGEQAAGLDAQHDVLQAGVLLLDVVHVVGGHVVRVVALAQLEQLLVDRVQLGDGVLLQLEEEVVRPEQVVIPAQLLIRLLPGCPAASRRGISADMQPEVQINPSACCARTSWSMRG